MDKIKRLVTINSLHSSFFELVAILAVANTVVYLADSSKSPSMHLYWGLHVALQNNVPWIGQIIINM